MFTRILRGNKTKPDNEEKDMQLEFIVLEF